ncbi:MAG TPA: hypothetical protein VMI72_16530 [Roseiarcus sp.]|nr:hypothetical protein [Roseiarcus sp.]
MTHDGFYNDFLIDERNDRPLMTAFVASIAIWSMAAMIALL